MHFEKFLKYHNKMVSIIMGEQKCGSDFFSDVCLTEIDR